MNSARCCCCRFHQMPIHRASKHIDVSFSSGVDMLCNRDYTKSSSDAAKKGTEAT